MGKAFLTADGTSPFFFDVSFGTALARNPSRRNEQMAKRFRLKFRRGDQVVYTGGSALSALGTRAGRKLIVVGQIVNRGRPYLQLKTKDDGGKRLVLSPARVRRLGGRRVA
jgi:hypothetical protein